MVRCESCGGEILWVLTPGGKRVPADAHKITVWVLRDKDEHPPKIEDTIDGYTSHEARCQWLQKQKKVK